MMKEATIFVYKKGQTAFLKANRRVFISGEPQVTHDSTARIAKTFHDFFGLGVKFLQEKINQMC
jgi:hypothetical protein